MEKEIHDVNCQEWLMSFLAERKEVLVDVIKAEAKAAGYTKKELKAAKKALRVKTVNDWEPTFGTSAWWWKLP